MAHAVTRIEIDSTRSLAAGLLVAAAISATGITVMLVLVFSGAERLGPAYGYLLVVGTINILTGLGLVRLQFARINRRVRTGRPSISVWLENGPSFVVCSDAATAALRPVCE